MRCASPRAIGAGTYTISKGGLITITFDGDFATGDAFAGSLQFQGSVALAEGEGNHEVIFSAARATTITIVPEEKNYSLNIVKVGVYVRDKEDAEKYEQLNMGIDILEGHVLYTLEVWADKDSDGSEGTIAITDKFMHYPGDGVVPIR